MAKRQIDPAANLEMFQTLISIISDPRRTLVNKMLEGKVGESYLTAPASSREDYHNCFPGGLLDHSIGVVKNLKRLAKSLCPDKYSDETLVFVGLFHDLGKAGDGVEDYYLPNENEYGRKRGFLYETNKKCVHMPTSERGLYILQKHGIELTPDEYLAIRLNDGQYVEENKPYRMKEPGLALLVHWADMWSSLSEKTE